MPSVQIGPSTDTLDIHTHVTQRYSVSSHVVKRSQRGSLVDRGANGGVLGNDAHVFLQHQRQVDVTGIDNHELNALKIVDASATVTTQHGPVIVIMKQYAYHGLGRTIHSAGQLEHYKNMVYDRSMHVGDKQCIRTLDGYIIPLDIINGLPYMKMRPNTSNEWEQLPHVILTSGDEWNPTLIDNILTDKDDWYNTLESWDQGLIKSPFDQFGNYKQREVPQEIQQPLVIEPPEVDDNIEVNWTELFHTSFAESSDLNRLFIHDTEIQDDQPTIESSKPREVKPKPIDYERYRPYLLHVPIEKIRRTFQNTTQHATNIMAGHNILQTINSPFPAHNVWSVGDFHPGVSRRSCFLA